MNTETVTTLQDNLRKMFDTIDRENSRRSSPNKRSINLTSDS